MKAERKINEVFYVSVKDVCSRNPIKDVRTQTISVDGAPDKFAPTKRMSFSSLGKVN